MSWQLSKIHASPYALPSLSFQWQPIWRILEALTACGPLDVRMLGYQRSDYFHTRPQPWNSSPSFVLPKLWVSAAGLASIWADAIPIRAWVHCGYIRDFEMVNSKTLEIPPTIAATMTSTNVALSFVPLGNGVYIKKPMEQEGLATTTEVPPPKYVKFFFFLFTLSHSIATYHF